MCMTFMLQTFAIVMVFFANGFGLQSQAELEFVVGFSKLAHFHEVQTHVMLNCTS